MQSQTDKNCYNCKYRRGIAGDAHSACGHPDLTPDAQLLAPMMLMAVSNSIRFSDRLSITGNLHGIQQGWFLYPVNFDPAWVEECTGFESRIEVKH